MSGDPARYHARVLGLRRSPTGSGRRARSFVSVHGVWLDVPPVSQFGAPREACAAGMGWQGAR
jgi:hypothetical protein